MQKKKKEEKTHTYKLFVFENNGNNAKNFFLKKNSS